MEEIERINRSAVVRNDIEKEIAIYHAQKDGMQWVSTSLVPCANGKGFELDGRYRMKFERIIRRGRRD